MARALEGRLERRPLTPEDGEERFAWVGRAAGRKRTLGRYPQMSETEARRELTWMIERVRRGEFKAERPTPAAPASTNEDGPPDIELIVNAFLDNLKGRGVGKSQVVDIEGLLVSYVLRHLRRADGTFPTRDQLGVAEVEALRDTLVAERRALDGLREQGVKHMDAETGAPLAPGESGGVRLPRGLGARRINRAIHSVWRAIDYGASRYTDVPDAKPMREAEDVLLVVKQREGPHLSTGQIGGCSEQLRRRSATRRPAAGICAVWLPAPSWLWPGCGWARRSTCA